MKLKIKRKKIIIPFVIVCIIFTFPFLMFYIPIKSCISELPININNEFYIVQYYDLQNGWFLVGDKTGLFDRNTMADYIVYIEGNDPKQTVTGDIYMWDRQTYFVIYGEAVIEEKHFSVNRSELVDRRYTIKSTRWDILGEIDSRNETRLSYSKKYLTVYDYKWSDDLRKFFGIFEDSVDY